MATTYDAELWRHNEVLHEACGVRPGDHVLDIGCGGGGTTRQAARAAPGGSALGVDISAAAIGSARDAARAEGIGNVTFEVADAQVHPFPEGRFDLALSRFGTMFFADQAAAFGNIGRALRPRGRLVMLVWQGADRNEWTGAIRRALGVPVAAGPDPFTLADPAAVRPMLEGAGFDDVAFADVHEPVFYGSGVGAALDWVRGFSCTSETLKRLEPAEAAGAVERLRDMLAGHLSDDGVWFDSRAWLITASRL